MASGGSHSYTVGESLILPLLLLAPSSTFSPWNRRPSLLKQDDQLAMTRMVKEGEVR